jgi:general secretion pathway protein G
MIVARSLFSLLEMMVVIAIIGFLAGILVVNLDDQADYAAQETTKATIGQVSNALKMYKLKHRKFPSTDEGLEVLVTDKQLNSYPEDAWGERLNYQYPSSRDLAFDIWSLGADRADGGDGPNADIFNEK